jgi:hypothetical protein
VQGLDHHSVGHAGRRAASAGRRTSLSGCRHEAAFARLAGTAPLEATSGQVQTRHRLSRGGDRALHLVTITRTRCHEPTRSYIARRVAEGETPREARRCLKRYLARHPYRLLEHPPTRLDRT